MLTTRSAVMGANANADKMADLTQYRHSAKVKPNALPWRQRKPRSRRDSRRSER